MRKLAQSQTLLIAPTGWGKTELILNEFKKSHKNFIFYSPLKALAQEFHERCKQKSISSILVEGQSHFRDLLCSVDEEVKTPNIYISTYEKICDQSFMRLIDGCFYHIFDEVHLNFLWGKSFRPLLLDFLVIYMHLNLDILLLTATCGEGLLDYLAQFPRLTIINVGNFKIKKQPESLFLALSQKKLIDSLPFIKTKTTLVFCKYRNQVKSLEKIYKEKGYNVLSCISGEVEAFTMGLSKMSSPDFIFSTSTLSHGVNLPSLSEIVITYRVKNEEVWTQMVGRGGRRGENFKVYQRDCKRGELKSSLIAYVKWNFFYLKTLIRRVRCK